MSFIDSPASPPESYVVRIYRRDPRGIAGTVEIVSSGSERSFSGARELVQILGGPARSATAAFKRNGGST